MRIVEALISKTPGHVLREYREAKSVSCEDFAKKLGVAEATLRSLENGTRKITADRAVDIETRTNGELTRYALRPDLFDSQRAAA